MFSCTKEVRDDLYERVNEVANNNTRGDDFSIWVLLLVEVPRASHPQELAIEASTIEY